MSVPLRVFWPQGLVPGIRSKNPGGMNTSASPLPNAPAGLGCARPPLPQEFKFLRTEAIGLATTSAGGHNFPPGRQDLVGGGGGGEVRNM